MFSLLTEENIFNTLQYRGQPTPKTVRVKSSVSGVFVVITGERTRREGARKQVFAQELRCSRLRVLDFIAGTRPTSAQRILLVSLGLRLNHIPQLLPLVPGLSDSSAIVFSAPSGSPESDSIKLAIPILQGIEDIFFVNRRKYLQYPTISSDKHALGQPFIIDVKTANQYAFNRRSKNEHPQKLQQKLQISQPSQSHSSLTQSKDYSPPQKPHKYHNLDSDGSAPSEESLQAPAVLSGQAECALSVKDERKFMKLLSRPYCGNSSDTKDGTMDQQVFSRGLEHFDQDGVHYVIAYKEAAHETQRAHFAVSQWEMEEASQLRHLRQYIHARERELLHAKTEEVESFMNMLVDRDDNQVTADLDYLVTSRESERITLDDLDKDLDTLTDHAFRTGILKLLSADSSEDRSEFDDTGDHEHEANGG
ncbi:uncharacterized protein F5891DRAFT_983803 [Suillus fuscotomentosus]|uniref:Uncharacterized protein n=1 Tax=Suillus fuscotomentosus TaxID=1912939 RepID=A0AAD4DXJ2_9AGAM|nr:uncharacterized protein F5891DRAFT_983803 [Suillus fuscotomentosus]KAG1895944.1 hypothetical protein F5891DRAFT_983803 [Suillus fuscotomentosus]